jgi:formylmethanofuran dehydrogenase subunit C
MITSIKRGDSLQGLDDLFGYTASDVEKTSTIEVVSSGNLNLALDEFKAYLKCFEKLKDDPFGRSEHNTNLVLTSEEINSYFLMIQSFRDNKTYRNTAPLLNSLIQNSYDAGNNDFTINLSEGSPYSLIYKLHGDENNPLKITVLGDISTFAGEFSSHLNLSVKGDIYNNSFFSVRNSSISIEGDVSSSFLHSSYNVNVNLCGNAHSKFGEFSTNLNAIIKGDVGKWFGLHSTNLNATINGNALTELGKGASNMSVIFEGGHAFSDIFFHSENCVFKSSNKELVERFNTEIAEQDGTIGSVTFRSYGSLISSILNWPQSRKCNKLVFVDEKKKEKVLRRFFSI